MTDGRHESLLPFFCRSCLCLFTSWQVSILSIFMKSCGNTDTISNELLDNHVRLTGDVITSIWIRTVVYLFNYFVSNLTEIWLMHFLKILQAVNYMWFLNLEEVYSSKSNIWLTLRCHLNCYRWKCSSYQLIGDIRLAWKTNVFFPFLVSTRFSTKYQMNIAIKLQLRQPITIGMKC